MVHEAVAQRYAAALFQLSLQRGSAQEMLDELRSVDKQLRSHRALARALQAPNVPSTVKKDICKRLFGHHSPVTLSFMCVLVDKGREDYVTEILRQYAALLDRASGVTKADIETAVELPTSVKMQLVEMLSKQEERVVQATWHVNTELLGGYIVRIGDRMLDRSLRAQLQGLERKLTGVA